MGLIHFSFWVVWDGWGGLVFGKGRGKEVGGRGEEPDCGDVMNTWMWTLISHSPVPLK
jgi:hypothetical protein